MKKTFKQTKILNIFIELSLLLTTLFATNVQATSTNDIYQLNDITMKPYESTNIGDSQTRTLKYSDIAGKEFFIKNMYSGQYLDVSGGVAEDGRNVQQYEFNGTDSQRWYIRDHGDGTYSFYTRLGNDGTCRYALDISNASAENYANVHIYSINGTDAQKFKILLSSYGTFEIATKVSDYKKAVVLNGPTCDIGRNVDQYTFQLHVNELWILEPVVKDSKLGIEYAQTNYNQYISAYPNLSQLGGDCANFASQCMLASGVHYQNDWYTYRKNDNYSAPTNVDQLNNSWKLSDPSPWISAKYFNKYWKDHSTYHYYKGKQITDDPSIAWNLSIVKGDVIQVANSVLGILGDAQHTMYITDYENSSYILTYHTTNTERKNLLDLCQQYPNSYFVFYEIM